MSTPGAKNAITDVEGLLVGQYSQPQAASGVTVVLCPEGAVAGVDVRGSAPGTRETDLMDPSNLVEKAQAVVLSGGSVYGLSTADGVVRWLSQQGYGFPLEQDQVAPIVPAAALFDLGRGQDYLPPIGPDWGMMACQAASSEAPEMGTIGAGTGALAGGVKGGLGTASERLSMGITVGAIVAVNSLGSVMDPASGLLWEARLELDDELGGAGQRPVDLPTPPDPQAAGNTTIGLVATDAALTKAQARKLAQMAHDGMARAIRPSHTMFDGDTIFCLATGKRELPDTPGFFAAPKAQAINELGRAAADCFCRAVMRGVALAESLGGMTALKDLPGR